MKISRLRERTLLLILVGAYVVALNLYYGWISNQLNIYEYPFYRPAWYAPLVSGFLYFLLLPGMPPKINRPSQGLLWLLYLMAYAPSLFIPLYTIRLSYINILQLDLLMAFLFWCLQVSTRLPLPRIPRIKMSWTAFLCIAVGITLLLETFAASKLGFHPQLVSPEDVYGVRADFKAELGDIEGPVLYVVLWLTYGLLPVLAAVGLHKMASGNYLLGTILIVYALIGDVYIFTEAGFKSVLFSVLFVFCLAYLIRQKQFGASLLTGLLFLAVLAFAIDLLGNEFIALHFVRRLLVAPGLDAGYYFEYFSQHSFFLMSDSILHGLVSSPYQSSAPFVIGAVYFGNSTASANANFWADGFANFGMLGMLLMTFLLCGLMWLTDTLTKHHSVVFTIPAIGMTAYALSNTGLLTTINSYGFAWVLILLWLCPATGRSAAPAPAQAGGR